MIRYIAIYMLLGAILSVVMYITSKRPLPIKREIAAHLTILLFWPIILVRIGKLFFKSDKEIQEISDRLDREEDAA